MPLKPYKQTDRTTPETPITHNILFFVQQTFEDINLPGNLVLQEILAISNIVFCVIFVFEMLMKWIGMGFVKYFTSFWCWLDFIVVIVSIKEFGEFLYYTKREQKKPTFLHSAYTVLDTFGNCQRPFFFPLGIYNIICKRQICENSSKLRENNERTKIVKICVLSEA